MTDDAESRGAENRSRTRLAGLVVALGVGMAAYRILVAGRLEQTAALFIGLPVVLATILSLAPPARSVTGGILKGTTLLLLLSAPLAGEGFICILMAAPLFYLVGILIGLPIDRSRRGSDELARRWIDTFSTPLLVPLLVLSLEGVVPGLSFSRNEEVSAEAWIAAPGQDVERALAATPRFDRPLPALFRLGFPEPVAASGEGLDVGDRRVIRFAGGEGKPGDLVLEVAERESGRVVFRVVSDGSHIAHWLDWREAIVRWEPAGPGGATRVEWTLRYERRLDPAWWFGPWERYAARRAAAYLIETLATPGS